MKKTYKYTLKNDEYLLQDSKGSKILSIEKSNLLLKGNEIYEGIFKNYKKNDEIEVQKKEDSDSAHDKLYNAIYDTLTKLINEIKDEIDKTE